MTTNGMDHSIGRWWDESLTPQDGCIWPDPPGPPRGCANCWAKRANKRWKRPTDNIELHPERLAKVLSRRKPTVYGVPINCGDLFQEGVPNGLVDECVTTLSFAERHTFILVTKRWKLCADYWSNGMWIPVPPKNIFIMFSAWDQASTDEAARWASVGAGAGADGGSGGHEAGQAADQRQTALRRHRRRRERSRRGSAGPCVGARRA